MALGVRSAAAVTYPTGGSEPEDVRDHALLEAWRRGDAVSGERLRDRHYAAVLRFFRIKVAHGAQRMTDRTFEAARVDDAEHDRASVRAYFFKLAREELLLRLRNRCVDGSFDPAKMSVKHLLQDDRTRLSQRLAQDEAQETMLGTFRLLPVDLEIAYELHHWEQFEAVEVAAVLGIAVTDVPQRLAQAREKLAAHLLATSTDERGQRLAADVDRWFCSLRPIYLGRPA